MSALENSPPTLREELDRKTFETLNWLITGQAKGILTDDQLSMGVDTLFMAVSGLVDEDFIRIITEAQGSAETTKGGVKRVFRHKESDTTVVFVWLPGQFSFKMTRYSGHMVLEEKDSTFKEREHARDYVLGVHGVLCKKGFIEL